MQIVDLAGIPDPRSRDSECPGEIHRHGTGRSACAELRWPRTAPQGDRIAIPASHKPLFGTFPLRSKQEEGLS